MTNSQQATNGQASSQTGSSTTQTGRTRCEVWTRVMGYHRPVQNFNIGKKSEHYSRKHFCETVTANTQFNNKFQ